ncbi:protoheme IX farnesyltransferase [Orientia chuto str. Dubai]|uniref:Protoheme IX farnesyltransferase n=1 Tax=Orientia chuto str. Dubai TaxID=1359168 RepID=A0A0F3MK16_9RICK|nr:heme o synthase [Candidatus Orientia mediorientalis]KJV56103.1 protoheme IX farnesyltransferase [Orientia chuto str. Dubai]
MLNSSSLHGISDKKNKPLAACTIKDFFLLMKPNVMLLAIFTAVTGLFIAPNKIYHLSSLIAILCISAGAGAAGAINMWYDADIDSCMKRTCNRPTVTGKIPPSNALVFGIILAFFSVLVMAIFINYLSSILLLISICFYIIVYTMWLKRRTAQNIVIGGAAGALSPVIGYSTATNNMDITCLLLFLIIFLWTPAHFWTLSLYCANDYKLANIPILPLVKGSNYTKYNILVYTFLTVIAASLPYFTNIASWIYLLCSTISGIIFLYYASMLFNDRNNILARKTFKYSIVYLFNIFLYLIIDHFI